MPTYLEILLGLMFYLILPFAMKKKFEIRGSKMWAKFAFTLSNFNQIYEIITKSRAHDLIWPRETAIYPNIMMYDTRIVTISD